LSKVTVSKVINNRPDIGQETKERVLAKIAELGYVPNPLARGLVTGRTGTLGIVVPDLSILFFSEIARSIESVAAKRGYCLLIGNSEEDPAKEWNHLKAFRQHRADGIFVASVLSVGQGESLDRLQKEGARMLLLDRIHPEVHCHQVGTDDEKVGWLATEHLIRLGHKRIAHLLGPSVSTAIGRMRGYQKALDEHGLALNPAWMVPCGFLQSEGYAAMQRLLERREPRVTAVFASNDPVAVGALQAIAEAGLRVPDDYAVVGAGDTVQADLLKVPLTSVGWDRGKMGKKAAELMLNQIESEHPLPPQRLVLEPLLLVRASCGELTGSGVAAPKPRRGRKSLRRQEAGCP
jgi:LacI family transcriptional regulator